MATEYDAALRSDVRVPLDDLVTGAQIAERFDVSTQRVHQMRTLPGFPAPLRKVGNALVWRWSEVERWKRARA